MIPSRIEKTVKQYHMLEHGDTVAVGVSGGADSMCLLHYLLSVRDKLDLKLTVLHIEHGIRGRSSKDDCDFVRQYCCAQNVAFRCLHIDAVDGAASAGKGIEEYSREQRYAFFEAANTDKIATAHNATDNLETVLFRLTRGTGLKGACGIPYVRGKIIRPLLDCTSAEIRDYCREQGIPYRTDETNAENAYSRNKIRNCVLPPLREINSEPEKALSRFVRSAAEDEDCLDSMADGLFRQIYHNNALSVASLRSAHPAVAKRVIVRLLSQQDYLPDEQHLNAVFRLIQTPGKVQLCGNLYAVANSQSLRLAVLEDAATPVFAVTEKQVNAAEFLNNSSTLKKEFAFYCDYDKISGGLSVRARKEGDSLRPSGRGVTKPLKKLYNELKIPVENRYAVPVICDDRGVIGVYGYAVDERVSIDKQTQTVLLVKVITEDKN